MIQPLKDIKIVEVTTATAGPAASKILIEYGAQSILVEPKTGIPNRNMEVHFDFSFSHKRSIALDLKTEEGMKVLHRLLESADVFLSNYRHRALVKMGLDFEHLHKEYPSLICAYVTGYGEYGDMRDDPGFDATAFWGKAGLLNDITEAGTAGGAPPVIPSAVGDINCGAMLAMGILAAIRERDKTGVGTKVTESLLSLGLYLNHSQMIFNQQGVHYPKSRLKPNRALSNSYPAKDGYFYLLTLNFKKDFNNILKVAGREDLIGDPRWNDMHDTEGEGAQELRRILDEAFSKFTLAELRDRFRAVDMAFGEFQGSLEAMHDPQAEANHYLTKIKYADGREVIVPNSPIQFNDETPREITPAVSVGHDTIEILREYGYSEEEIKTLLESDCVRADK